jgi:hypothetical protein
VNGQVAGVIRVSVPFRILGASRPGRVAMSGPAGPGGVVARTITCGTTHGGPSTLIVAGPLPSRNAIERDSSPLGLPSRCISPLGR